jgi:hypothetical protein
VVAVSLVHLDVDIEVMRLGRENMEFS